MSVVICFLWIYNTFCLLICFLALCSCCCFCWWSNYVPSEYDFYVKRRERKWFSFFICFSCILLTLLIQKIRLNKGTHRTKHRHTKISLALLLVSPNILFQRVAFVVFIKKTHNKKRFRKKYFDLIFCCEQHTAHTVNKTERKMKKKNKQHANI